MTTLLEALYRYAQKERIEAMLTADSQKEIEASIQMASNAMDRLNAMGPAAADDAQRLSDGWQLVSDLYEQSSFLAGLSMGLELSRL